LGATHRFTQTAVAWQKKKFKSPRLARQPKQLTVHHQETPVLNSVVGKSASAQFGSFAGRLDLESGERWFVARVHPHRESTAQLNLDRLGFRSFAPRVRRTVRHARKIRSVLAPLFPGYIFLILDLTRDRWRCVNSTFGVASLIMGVEQPIPVPQGIVETLVAATESSGTVRLDTDLEIGQKLRILSGPFAETLCRLVHLDDRGRVRVLLEFMGAEVSARLDRSCVAPAA
jgi:transcription antitermination factor NusG